MKKITLAGLTATLSIFSTAALAHHPLGGETPTTAMNGLLSGIGHPIIGLDHLAFVVAVGIAAVLVGSRFLLPLAFVAATVLGTLVHLMAVGLPAVELVIALSVAAIGAILLSGKKVSLPLLAGLFAFAGMFHGHAYGEAIFGAEATPLLSYLAGFGITQYAIAVIAGSVIAAGFGNAAEWSVNVPARIVGGFVAGMGALMLSDHAFAALGFAALMSDFGAGVSLILGGARSGKSAFAEKLTDASGRRKVYLATSQIFDGEMESRVDLHRQQRGPEWQLVEEPLDLVGSLAAHAGADACILVDCLTLWLTNLMMAERDISADCRELVASFSDLPHGTAVLFVSNEVGQGIVPMEKMARDFRDHAGRLHQDIAAAADNVWFVTAGLPQKLK